MGKSEDIKMRFNVVGYKNRIADYLSMHSKIKEDDFLCMLDEYAKMWVAEKAGIKYTDEMKDVVISKKVSS